MNRTILDNILNEFGKVEPIELPENVLKHFGGVGIPFTDMYHEERFGYINVAWGQWQIVLGYGDRDGSKMWNGVLSWSIQKGYDTHPNYFDGEITNGSPDFVVWSLFEQLSEQIEELGECDNCSANYDPSSRFGRCGECGNCSKCCSHLKETNNA